MPVLMPVVVLLAASLLWGLAWLPLKAINHMGLAGLWLSVVAYGCVSAVFLPCLWRGRRPTKGTGQGLLLILLLGGYANLAFTIALIHGQVVRVMLLFYLLPAWSVLGGWWILGEAVDGRRIVAVLAALGGAVLLLQEADMLVAPLAWPDLLAITSGVAFALNNIMFRRHRSIPVTAKIAVMTAGCVLMSLTLVLISADPWPEVDGTAWIWAVAYGLGWLLLATLGTQWGVTHLQAGPASFIIMVELLVAVVTATWLGGEVVTTAEFAGGALIVGAALFESARAVRMSAAPAGAR